MHKVLHLVFEIVQLPARVNWTTGQTSHPYFGFLLEHVSWLKSIFDSIVIVKNVSRSVAQQLHDSLTNTEPKVKHPRFSTSFNYIWASCKTRLHSQMFAQVVLPCGSPLGGRFPSTQVWTVQRGTMSYNPNAPEKNNISPTSETITCGHRMLLFIVLLYQMGNKWNQTDFVSTYSRVLCFGN